MSVLVLTGVRGDAQKTNNDEHVVFRFDYVLSDVGAVHPFEVPAQARRLLR